jgi:hypothetical protein
LFTPGTWNTPGSHGFGTLTLGAQIGSPELAEQTPVGDNQVGASVDISVDLKRALEMKRRLPIAIVLVVFGIIAYSYADSRDRQPRQLVTVTPILSSMDVDGAVSARVLIQNHGPLRIYIHSRLPEIYVRRNELGINDELRHVGGSLEVWPLPVHVLHRDITAIEPGRSLTEDVYVEPSEGYETRSVAVELQYVNDERDFTLENRHRRKSVPRVLLWGSR